MSNLILTAENYAFGPIGKLLYVADFLKNSGHKLTFGGFGTSLQLAKKFPFDAIYELDTDEPSSAQKLEELIANSDALVSSMDFATAAIANKLKKPTVWIDCLFWFWDEIPQSVFNVDLYIRERSLDDSVNEGKYGTLIKNLQTVGPIIGRAIKTERQNQALVSFGGGQASHYYQVGKDTNYPFVMTNILLEHIDWASFEKVLVATSETIVTELKKRFPNTNFEFVTLAHDRFLEEMSKSQILLTTPGLITAQGAFYTETPTVFIPASNDSQYLQLEELRTLGLANASVGLDDFMPKLHLVHIPVQESTRLMLKQLRELEELPDVQKRVGVAINSFVQSRAGWENNTVEKGKQFINELGGNGAEAASKLINELLSSKGF